MLMQRESKISDFNFMKKVGEGAFGEVHLVKRKANNQSYALKKVKLTGLKNKEKENALNQIRILASLDDQFVIKFKDAFFDEVSQSLCIVMEYANGGDLSKMITKHKRSGKNIPEAEIWKAMINITKGLYSLHEKKILHRDLKSANVFISDGVYKLGDLNVSKVLKQQLASTQTGTPYYASPQVWQDKPYGAKSDMWSLGCVLYQMATLQPPFKGRDLESLYKKVLAGKYNPIPSSYSKELSEIISLLLRVRPRERLGSDNLIKNNIVIEKCNLREEEEKENLAHNSMLLQTIKYNPHNPRGLNRLLPRASYDKEDHKFSLKTKTRTQSVDSSTFSSDRVVSSHRLRSQIQQPENIQQYKKCMEIRKVSEKNLPPIPKNGYGILPPILSSPPSRGNLKTNESRLSKAGRRILY